MCRVLPHSWQVWLTLDHDSLSEKGYKQTGPTLPLEPLLAGGVAPEDLGLYKDLQPFWERIGGDAVYTDAVAHVDNMWDRGIVRTWADAHTLVETHDPHPGIVEGCEGAEWDVVDESSPAADGTGIEGGGGDDPGIDNTGGADGGKEPEAMVDANEGKTVALHSNTSSVQCMCHTPNTYVRTPPLPR